MTALVRHMAIFAGLLAGCVAYQPGSFSHGVGQDAAFAGRRGTVGCLDVAVERRADRESSAVLAYRFGNRCNGSALVELGRVVVVARFADGRQERLAPYDPENEIRPVRLAGRLSGGEAIAYPGAEGAVQVCAELSAITTLAGAGGAARQPAAPPDPDAPQRWLCFAPSPTLEGADPVTAAASEVAP